MKVLTRTTEEISEKLDKLGSSISFNSSGRSSSIYVSAVSNIDQTLELLDEKLFNPAFNKRILSETKQLKESINNSKKSAQSMAQEAMMKVLYGKTIRGTMPTVKGVEKLKLSDVKEFYNKQYNSTLASIVVVGDMTKEQIMPKLKFLNKWGVNKTLIKTFNVSIEGKPFTWFTSQDLSPLYHWHIRD